MDRWIYLTGLPSGSLVDGSFHRTTAVCFNIGANLSATVGQVIDGGLFGSEKRKKKHI